MAALDVAEVQVAVDFQDDPVFLWHVRVPVVKLGEGSRWVCFTPDLESEVIDLSEHSVVVLSRRAPKRLAWPGASTTDRR